MLKPLVAGLAAFLASAAGMAIAQDGPPPPQAGSFENRAMMRADANGDGIVTRDEYMADAARRFDRLDRNHDGRIDQTEMQQMGQRGPGPKGGRRQGGGMGGDMPPPPAPAGMAPQP